MESAATVFPRPGTRVTYAKAFESYNALEEAMLAKVYNESFIPSVKMYDLMWEIDSVANKYDMMIPISLKYTLTAQSYCHCWTSAWRPSKKSAMTSTQMFTHLNLRNCTTLISLQTVARVAGRRNG